MPKFFGPFQEGPEYLVRGTAQVIIIIIIIFIIIIIIISFNKPELKNL